MEAYVEQEFTSRAVKVWLFDRTTRGLTFYHYGGGGVWNQEQQPADAPADVEPTFVLPAHALKALVEAGTDFLPPSAATDRHLEDAITTRDRVLSLVERLVPEQHLSGS